MKLRVVRHRPFLLAEPQPRHCSVWRRRPGMLVRWGTEVQCASAIARLERDGALSEEDASEAFDTLRRFADGWHEVDASDGVREAAVRLLRVHSIRAAEALQLAAAFIAAERRPPSLELITLDERLSSAARKEGFVVVDVAPGR